MEWAWMSYPPDPKETCLQEEVHSGEVWQYRLYRIPMLEEVSGFAGSRYALRLERRVICKGGGEVREEVAYALTSLEGRPEELLALWRGHWEVENRLHHPRDTVLGEDARAAARVRRGYATPRRGVCGMYSSICCVSMDALCYALCAISRLVSMNSKCLHN